MEKSISSLECFLDGYLHDGACMEGFYYWGYGFGFFVYAADLIKLRTGGSVDLLQNEKVKNIAEFQHKCFLSGDQVVNFADAQRTGRLNIGLAHYLASIFPTCEVPEQTLRTSFSDDHCGRWAPAMRNLLWFNPDLQGKPWPEASFWLADAEWLISRYVTDSGTYAFAAKGGHNEEPHNHNDVGHFLLHINGESLLTDMGWGEYTAEYFSEARYDFICTSSAGHSVPVVAGQYQRPGKDRKAKVLQIEQGECADILELDITKTYDVEQLQSLVRRMVWWKGQVPRLVLIDTFQWQERETDQMDRDSGCKENFAMKERFICMSRPIAIEDGQLEIVGEQGNRLYVNYDAEQFVPEVKKLTMRDHYGKWIDYYALDFTMITNPKTSVAKFEFVLVAKHE